MGLIKELTATLRKSAGERGVVLITALLVMVFLLPLGVIFLQVALTESNIASNEVALARAFNLGEAGLQHASKALQALDLSEVLDGTTNIFPGGNTANLAGGSYTVQVINNIAANGFPRGTIPVDPSGSPTVDGDRIVLVTSTGNFQASQQAVETTYQIVPFPEPPGALTQASTGTNGLRLEDSSLVSGFDESGTCADEAGLVYQGTLDLNLDGGTLEGAPDQRAYSSPPDDPNSGDPASILSLISYWSSLPGVVTISGQPPATLGTPANPQITVLQGSGDIKDSPFTGYGILIVTGELEIRNNFEFHGLVIVNSSDRVRIRDADNQGFHGGLIVVSNSDTDVRFEDQTQVRYNCAEIDAYAKAVVPPPATVMAWRQVF